MGFVKKQAAEFAEKHVTVLAQEIIEWNDTAVLPDGKLRELAAIWAQVDTSCAMSLAEATATRAALEAVAAK